MSLKARLIEQISALPDDAASEFLDHLYDFELKAPRLSEEPVQMECYGPTEKGETR